MSRPKSDYWRTITERYDKPYDRTADGAVLTVSMDRLECGHELKSSVITKHDKTIEAGQIRRSGQVDPDIVRRLCKRCEREAQA